MTTKVKPFFLSFLIFVVLVGIFVPYAIKLNSKVEKKNDIEAKNAQKVVQDREIKNEITSAWEEELTQYILGKNSSDVTIPMSVLKELEEIVKGKTNTDKFSSQQSRGNGGIIITQYKLEKKTRYALTGDFAGLTPDKKPKVKRTDENKGYVSVIIGGKEYRGNINDIQVSLDGNEKTSIVDLKRYYDHLDDITPPSIVITHPQVSRGVGVFESSKSVVVRGIVYDENGVNEVSANGIEANLSEGGEFLVEVLLSVGENKIDVLATDTKRNTASETFTIVRQSSSDSSSDTSTAPKQLESTGKYYALLIGVQDYPDSSLNDLDKPLQDAKKLESLLIGNYTFVPSNVRLLPNPDRSTIIATFDELSRQITAEDSLLIFYAGHGYWDERFQQGYWLPSDASKGNKAEWISNGTVRDYIRGIQSKHTLLITDSCFSGGIFKTRTAFSNAPASVQQLHKIPSRKAMTSGTLNEVPDKSVFIEYLTKRLQENSEPYLSSEELFSSFRTAVINNSPVNQIPQFGEIRESGDEGGDFIFIKRDKINLLKVR